MMNRISFYQLPFLLILLTACFSKKEKEAVDVLILNAKVVDVQADNLIPDQFIAIKGDKILVLGTMKEATYYDAKKTIDAKGDYVMPGLWDNHVHFRGGEELIAENKAMLALFLRFGITTVRDAGGDITPAIQAWQQEMNQGKLSGPRIFTSGPKLDGSKPAWEGSIKIESNEDIAAALDSLQALGVDYVKMYDGSLSKKHFYAIIEAAEARGMKTTGHMPMSADLRTAIALGLDGSEHLYYIMKACSPLADSLTALGMGYGMMELITDSYDEALAQALFAEMQAKQVYLTPTLYIGQVLANLAEVDHSADSLLPYIGEGIQKTYERRLKAAIRAKNSGNQMRQKVQELGMRIIRPMFDAGVPLLAGSDCGPFNSFVYPGEALWGELYRLVDAGLSPAEALETSIVNGPAFFGLEQSYGSIAQDKQANLLILSKNPLDNIRHLESLQQVIKSGQIVN